MSYVARLLVLAAFAFVLHLTLGWAWTTAAGVAAGLWRGRGGWHLGAASVGLEWGALVVYSYAVDARAVHIMTTSLGSMFGNMPFFAIVALTPAIGAALGLVGGVAGTQLNRLTGVETPAARAT